MQTHVSHSRAIQILLLVGAWAAVGCSASRVPGETATRLEDGLPGKPNASQETLEHLSSLPYELDPANHAEDGFPCVNCPAGSETTLSFTPVRFAHEVDWPEARGRRAKGHFVAKITNTGPYTAQIGLDKDETAYLWVGLVRTFAGIELKRTAAIYRFRGNKIKRLGTARRVAYCSTEPPPVAAIHLHANPQCDETDIRPSKVPPHRKTDDAPARHHTGLWISCGGGCCEAAFDEL